MYGGGEGGVHAVAQTRTRGLKKKGKKKGAGLRHTRSDGDTHPLLSRQSGLSRAGGSMCE